MSNYRDLPGFSIDRMAKMAGNDPDVLRMENLDTDLPPPEAAIIATREAIGKKEFNSYLPFIGQKDLRQAVADKIALQTNCPYKRDQVIITSGATEAMLDVLLALLETGDEVILTDPCYAGMIQRVKIAGGKPVFVPFRNVGNEWRLDTTTLTEAVTGRTKAIFIMNPSMPSGAVLNLSEWDAIKKICTQHNIWLLYNSSMERVLFDRRKVIHPVTLPGMENHTITIGSVSKEYRMISWRIGWIVAPKELIDRIEKIHIYNAITPGGFSQQGALAALQTPEEDIRFYNQVLEVRRNVVLEELKKYKIIPAAGGWSQLLDVSPLGLNGETAALLLMERGKIAATPMTHWGDKNSRQFLRLVFSREPVERLQTLGERFRKAFGNGS